MEILIFSFAFTVATATAWGTIEREMYKDILNLILLLSLFDFVIDISESKPLDDDVAPEVESETTTESVTDPDYYGLDAEKSTTTSGESDTATLIANHESEFASVVCPHFVNSSRIDTDAMVDVWQTVYYREPHKVPCFRMQIRKLSSEEKSRYQQLYGDFNDRVVWEDVGLEVRARSGGGAGRAGGGVVRRHFLQGCERGRGVLENIILEQNDNSTAVSLVEETPDQWRVAGNVLIMKDCESGELVAFSRVPHQPKLTELAAAADGFGPLAGGDWACRETGDHADKRHAFDGEFETFSDVVFFE